MSAEEKSYQRWLLTSVAMVAFAVGLWLGAFFGCWYRCSN